MLILITSCIFLGLLSSLCLFYILKQKTQPDFCKRVDELYGNFLTHKEKYEYKKLPKSYAEEKMLVLHSNKPQKIFCEKLFYQKFDFLSTLSKFIDLKLNSNKQTFRTKNKKILIDEISWVVAYSSIISNECNLFKLYKKLYFQYNLKTKEHKIFKPLLGQKLLYLLFEIESEICDISKIIERAKKTRKIKKYKKKIYYLAELYSVKKFHPNSTKILSKYNYNYSRVTALLLLELCEIEKKQKIIISYLISMFC